MNIEEKRIKIAEACGWKRRTTETWEFPWMNPDTKWSQDEPPDYFNDLNAMHDVEMTRSHDERFKMATMLKDMAFIGQCWSCCEDEHWSLACFTTAAQRAEAFGLTLGLWKEGE